MDFIIINPIIQQGRVHCNSKIQLEWPEYLFFEWKMFWNIWTLNLDPGVQVRVANVVEIHDDLLTKWRPISMSKFRVNIFLIRTTSNYFWASEVFKNQRFKRHLFSFSQYKKYSKLKTWVNFLSNYHSLLIKLKI